MTVKINGKNLAWYLLSCLNSNEWRIDANRKQYVVGSFTVKKFKIIPINGLRTAALKSTLIYSLFLLIIFCVPCFLYILMWESLGKDLKRLYEFHIANNDVEIWVVSFSKHHIFSLKEFFPVTYSLTFSIKFTGLLKITLI